MASPFIEIITSADPKIRNQPLDAVCSRISTEELLAACGELDDFRRSSDNSFTSASAPFFLYAIHRFHLPAPIAGRGQQP